MITTVRQQPWGNRTGGGGGAQQHRTYLVGPVERHDLQRHRQLGPGQMCDVDFACARGIDRVQIVQIGHPVGYSEQPRQPAAGSQQCAVCSGRWAVGGGQSA